MNPFQQFGNGKVKKKKLPKFGNGKGMKISGMGIRGFRSWEGMGIGIPTHPLKCYG